VAWAEISFASLQSAGRSLLGGILLLNVVRVTRINAGYVGVEVNLAGSQRGAQDIPVRTGWVFYSPLKTQVIEFPTFVQTVKWTSDINEGHPLNEELVFNSKEGQEVRTDVSLSYAIDAVRVPEFYVKYRTDDLERFTHGILKDIVRNSLNEVASTYTLEDIYGENKARFLCEARERIQAQVEPVGVGIPAVRFHRKAALHGGDRTGNHAEDASHHRGLTCTQSVSGHPGRDGQDRCRS
jgi:regulator of protease activity HflC (stomatin/prohibitin superfamily)